MKTHILLHNATDATPILISVDAIDLACKSDKFTGATTIFGYIDEHIELLNVTETPEQIYELING